MAVLKKNFSRISYKPNIFKIIVTDLHGTFLLRKLSSSKLVSLNQENWFLAYMYFCQFIVLSKEPIEETLSLCPILCNSSVLLNRFDFQGRLQLLRRKKCKERCFHLSRVMWIRKVLRSSKVWKIIWSGSPRLFFPRKQCGMMGKAWTRQTWQQILLPPLIRCSLLCILISSL